MSGARGLILPGGFGNRSGRAWSREYSADRDRHLPTPDPAGFADSVMRLEPHIIRRALAASQCPWCARVLKNIALHTYQAHGVSARELRKMAEVGQKTSICSPDLSQGSRERWLSRPDREKTTRRAFERSQADPRTAAKRTAAAVARTERLHAEQWARAEELFQAGELTFAEIADDVGLHPSTLSRGLRERGHDVDAARRRAHRANLDERARPRAVEARRELAAAEAQRVTTRFRRLGGDWPAVAALAEEGGVSERYMRNYLRRHQVELPDGRKVSLKKGRAGGRTYPTKPKSRCTVDGCTRDARCRGLCGMHYQRWRAARASREAS